MIEHPCPPYTQGHRVPIRASSYEEEKVIVGQAFETGKGLGIGLTFEEVDSRDEAEMRIGFERGDRAWSYTGR